MVFRPNFFSYIAFTLHSLGPSEIRSVSRNDGNTFVTAKTCDIASLCATTGLVLNGMLVFVIFMIKDMLRYYMSIAYVQVLRNFNLQSIQSAINFPLTNVYGTIMHLTLENRVRILLNVVEFLSKPKDPNPRFISNETDLYQTVICLKCY